MSAQPQVPAHLVGSLPSFLDVVAPTREPFVAEYTRITGKRSAAIAEKVWLAWRAALLTGLTPAEAAASAIVAAQAAHRRVGLTWRPRGMVKTAAKWAGARAIRSLG